MAETYIKLDDILAKKKFCYDLKQYAVTEKDIRSAEKIEYVPDDTVEELERAVKVLSNRCAVNTGGLLCGFCGVRHLCDQHRTAYKEGKDG